MENQSKATGQNNPQDDNAGNADYQTINAFLADSAVMLENTKSNPDILNYMENAGYPKADIDAKLAELNALRDLNEAQAKEYGEQYQATESWQVARAAFHKPYMRHLGLARIALKHNVAAQKAMALRGDRAQSQSGYIGQALLFYSNAMEVPDFKAALSQKGVTGTDLADGKAKAESLQNLRAAQRKETGEAQQATKKRDAAYDDLHDWMSDYRATARIVLADAPQLMEEIGIVEPS